MALAFDLKGADQMLNVPRALQVGRYRFEMTLDAPVAKAAMMQLMWSVASQAFQVRLHVEERTASTLALVIGKHGPKFKRLTKPSQGQYPQIGPGVIRFDTIAQLLDFLSNQPPQLSTNRVFVDKTGLSGAFDIELITKNHALDGPGALLALVREQLGLDFVNPGRTAQKLYVVIDSATPLRGTWIKP